MVKIGVPSKGRLMEKTFEWFGTRGLKPHRLNTCNPLTVIARLTNAGTGAAMLPREMLRLSGDDLRLRDGPVHGGAAADEEGARPVGHTSALLASGNSPS
jgi:hypothetical protein